jgi:hypothetical protein
MFSSALMDVIIRFPSVPSKPENVLPLNLTVTVLSASFLLGRICTQESTENWISPADGTKAALEI